MRRALELLARGNPLRIGVEFLPPAEEETSVAVQPARVTRAEAVAAEPPRIPAAPRERSPYGRREPFDRHTWTMSSEDLAAIRNPIANETLQFIDDVMGEDRRRLKRELGTPILTMQSMDLQSPGIDLHADGLQDEDEAIWMTDNGINLLKRPFQHLLRRFPVVRSLELELDDFKSENLQLSEAWLRAHKSDGLGRVSVRVHATDMRDPIEMTYMRSGIRLGTSQERLKVGFGRHISQGLRLELRSRHDYDSGSWRLRADLSWAMSEQTSLHLVAGDDLDFLTTSTVYSLFDSPMDGSPGLLVYAVHLF